MKTQLSTKLMDSGIIIYPNDRQLNASEPYKIIEAFNSFLAAFEKLAWEEHTFDWDLHLRFTFTNGETLDIIPVCATISIITKTSIHIVRYDENEEEQTISILIEEIERIELRYESES